MSLISTGYDGSVQESEVAQILAFAGSLYGTVATNDAWKVTAIAGNRRVAVAPGTGYDGFVYATEASSTLLDLTLPTGQTAGGRWFLIAAERDWTKNSTRFVALIGAATTAATPSLTLAADTWRDPKPVQLPADWPAGFTQTPGALSHQPIAWVFVNTSTTTVLVYDLRRRPARAVPMTDTGLLLGSDNRNAVAPAPGATVQSAVSTVRVPDYTPALVVVEGRWLANGNAAGSIYLTRGGNSIGPNVRQHNEGRSTAPVPFTHLGRTTLVPGDNKIEFWTATEQASSGARYFYEVRLSVWAL